MPKYINKRSYKKFDPSEFVAAVEQISWLDVYLCTDVDMAVELLSEKIVFILDVMAPMKCIQLRKHYNPWLSDTTKELMAERDKLHKVAILSKKDSDWANYKKKRNEVVKRQKVEEASGQRLKLSQCGQDSSKIWNNVKNILHWTRNGAPNQLFYEGKLVSKSQELAAAQNKFFLDKIDTIKMNLPLPTMDPLSKLKALMSDRRCSFSFQPVHPDSIEKVIDKLKNSNSFGLDRIDTKIIKLIKPYILPSITHVINLSLETKVFPKK